MIDKLAVIISGELRTWRYASRYIFNFFKNRANEIDYFFVTWNLSLNTPVIEKDITDFFGNNKLQALRILPPIKEKHTYKKQHFLAKIGNILKKEYELSNNFVYDQVVYVRPDIYYRKNGNPWKICQNFCYSISSISIDQPEEIPHVNDVYFRTNSFTDDLLSQKYYQELADVELALVDLPGLYSFKNHHYWLANWILKHNFVPLTYSTAEQDFLYFFPLRWYHDFSNFEEINLDVLNYESLLALFPPIDKILPS
jgi:hypothetical protein